MLAWPDIRSICQGPFCLKFTARTPSSVVITQVTLQPPAMQYRNVGAPTSLPATIHGARHPFGEDFCAAVHSPLLPSSSRSRRCSRGVPQQTARTFLQSRRLQAEHISEDSREVKLQSETACRKEAGKKGFAQLM